MMFDLRQQQLDGGALTNQVSEAAKVLSTALAVHLGVVGVLCEDAADQLANLFVHVVIPPGWL